MEEELVEFFLGFSILGKIILLKSDSAVAGSHGRKHILRVVAVSVVPLLGRNLLLTLFIYSIASLVPVSSWFLWLSSWLLFLLSLFAFLVELLDLLVKDVENEGLLIFFHILDDSGRFGLRNALKDCFDATLGGLESLLEFFDEWGADELVKVGLDFGVDGIAIGVFALLNPVEGEDEVSQHLLGKNNGRVA